MLRHLALAMLTAAMGASFGSAWAAEGCSNSCGTPLFDFSPPAGWRASGGGG